MTQAVYVPGVVDPPESLDTEGGLSVVR